MRTFVIIVILFSFIGLICSNVKIDSLNSELTRRKEADKIKIYNLLAEAHWYIAPDRTIEYAETALELAIKHGDREQESLALINIGNGFMFSGNFKEALEYHLLPGLELARKIKFDKGIAGGLNSIAACYMNLGNYNKALNTFNQSLQIMKEKGDQNKAARIKMNIASLYINWGNYDEALKFYFEALEVFEKAGDKELLSRSLNNIAIAYHSWGNYDKALEFYNRSLDLYNELNDDIGKAIPLNNIGEIYKDQGKFSTALEYYTEVMEIVSQTENKQTTGIALQGAGEALKGLGDYDLATDYLQQALDYFIAIGFQEGIANSYYDLGDIYRIKQEPEKALEHLNKSLELAEVSNIVELMKDNFLLLSQIYAEKEYYQTSLNYYKKYSSLKDSTFTKETNEKIHELDIKYNTARKEKEIVVLKERNKLQKIYGIFLIIALMLIFIILIILFIYYRSKEKANKILKEANTKIQKQRDELETMNQELQELNATKNKFFSIISHDLKNAFISQLTGSRLLFKDIDELDSETIKTFTSELHKSAENLYKLLHNLLDWSKIQMGGVELHPQLIELEHFFKDEFGILEALAARKSIKLNFEIDPELQITADKNMLVSIFQSLINNSIKFSYPDSEITIKANSENGHIKFSVIDQGVGMETNDLEKLFRIDENFTTKGTASEKGTGLGLILCKEFIDLHSGEISVRSKLTEGTEVSFTLPTGKQRSNNR